MAKELAPHSSTGVKHRQMPTCYGADILVTEHPVSRGVTDVIVAGDLPYAEACEWNGI